MVSISNGQPNFKVSLRIFLKILPIILLECIPSYVFFRISSTLPPGTPPKFIQRSFKGLSIFFPEFSQKLDTCRMFWNDSSKYSSKHYSRYPFRMHCYPRIFFLEYLLGFLKIFFRKSSRNFPWVLFDSFLRNYSEHPS